MNQSRKLIYALVSSLLLISLLASSSAAAAPAAANENSGTQIFYTVSGTNAGTPLGAEIWAIMVSHSGITFKDVGPTYGGSCGTLARSSTGKLYDVCGNLFGTQNLATIDPKTGKANIFGVGVNGLAVMALSFGPDGKTLYAVGDCNPDPVTFECNTTNSAVDPSYNSLYKVDTTTGAFTRIGATGAPQFFMALTVTPNGRMIGVTTTVNPSSVPAILYNINLATGKATKISTLVGSNSVMGIAYGSDGRLYANDFTNNPGLYRINVKTGFETAIAALPFSDAVNLVLMNP